MTEFFRCPARARTFAPTLPKSVSGLILVSGVNAVHWSGFSFPTFPQRARKDGAPVGLARVRLSGSGSWRWTSRPQGLKPGFFCELVGTTEVVPFPRLSNHPP